MSGRQHDFCGTAGESVQNPNLKKRKDSSRLKNVSILEKRVILFSFNKSNVLVKKKYESVGSLNVKLQPQ